MEITQKLNGNDELFACQALHTQFHGAIVKYVRLDYLGWRVRDEDG